jgi:DNA (cytosine-5)-methyltransferase 1
MLKNTEKFSFIDLFAGIGGFRLGLNRHGGKCLNFSEINKDAIDTYCVNFDEPPTYNLGDITKIKALPQHDLLVGGVPCQSWSIAGRNLGFDDDRGQLWNDTIFLLNQSRPKAFIFENVKGLVDPRNKEALSYIMQRIKEAGYFADYYVLNSFNYGVPQNRIRIFIVGFLNKKYHDAFKIAQPIKDKIHLKSVLSDIESNPIMDNSIQSTSLPRNMSLSNNKGFNDYFLFNDLRNGHSTIHSWDITETTDFQKHICYLLLKNRRKNAYGNLDGNPLSLNHFKDLDPSITAADLQDLVDLEILKREEYVFSINEAHTKFSEEELNVLNCARGEHLNIDDVKNSRQLRVNKTPVLKIIEGLKKRGVIKCIERRYDFKNSKISTGLNGISRIFLPSSSIFPTLVASDTHDFIATQDMDATTAADYKTTFLNTIYKEGKFRKITKEEACQVQGFPKNFKLPETRSRWMKLLGNSVSVPVVEMLGKAIMETGVFEDPSV